MSTPSIIGKAGQFNISFRDVTLSSRAGFVLLSDFIARLGVADILDRELHVKTRERGYRDSEAILSLSHNLIAGGSCLLDLNVLRGDPGTQRLLGLVSMIAPTTAGEFLRKFDIGDIHDLNRALLQLQQRVRPHQAATSCTLDVDSSIFEQASTDKDGAVTSYTGQVGYHPFFVFWYEEAELVFSHLRRGNAYTSSKFEWCLKASLKRLPPTAPKKLRADSGLYDRKAVAFCEQRRITFGISADQTAPLLRTIEALSDRCWQNVPDNRLAEVAAFNYQPTGWKHSYRYIVKRELRENAQREVFFHYYVFVTNDDTTPSLALLNWKLQHANMENFIKEYKSGFQLEKLPTHDFHANWAYLLIGQLAFNLVAWFKRLILPTQYHAATLKTIQHQVLNVAGKIVHTARQFFLVLSDDYQFQAVWLSALQQLANLPFA